MEIVKPIVLGVNTEKFINWYSKQGVTRNNGAYWYSKEIEDIILPHIDRKIFIVTAGAKLYNAFEIIDNAVVVCHDNRSPKNSYGSLFNKNILWICSKHSTVKLMESYGERAAYVPLSINAEYVKTFKTKKTKDTAFVGNSWGFKRSYLNSLPKDITQLSNLERDDMLREMAKYKKVIAEGRCLMEAQVLGCDCEAPKYKDLESVYVDVLDSNDAVPFWIEALQNELEFNNLVRAIITFKDLQAKRKRIEGEVFMATDSRLEELLSYKDKLVEIL